MWLTVICGSTTHRIIRQTCQNLKLCVHCLSCYFIFSEVQNNAILIWVRFYINHSVFIHNSTSRTPTKPSFATPSLSSNSQNKGIQKYRTCSEYEIINLSPAEPGPIMKTYALKSQCIHACLSVRFRPFIWKAKTLHGVKLKYIKTVVSKWHTHTHTHTLQWYRTKQGNCWANHHSSLQTGVVNSLLQDICIRQLLTSGSGPTKMLECLEGGCYKRGEASRKWVL